jgi:hypothetical protein
MQPQDTDDAEWGVYESGDPFVRRQPRRDDAKRQVQREERARTKLKTPEGALRALEMKIVEMIASDTANRNAAGNPAAFSVYSSRILALSDVIQKIEAVRAELRKTVNARSSTCDTR